MLNKKNDQVVAVIDLKAFFATVECVERGLDPFMTPLIVADKSRGTGTIVLSVSPFLKAHGIPSRCRLFEIPKDKHFLIAQPRMSLYLKKSADVMSILLDFIGEDDLHVYSIDEAFINLGPYLQLYQMGPIQLVKTILDKIHQQLGLYATAGIGQNNFIAKCALDHEAKKITSGIAYWTIDDLKEKLWPISPLSNMWGIAKRLERRLNALGINTIGQLANFSKQTLKSYFGIIGEQLHNHANGIDNSKIREKYIAKQPSFNMGQVLFRDYSYEEVVLVIKEMADDLCMRLRLEGRLAGSISLFIGYSQSGGFARQMSLMRPSDDNETLTDALLNLYNRHINKNQKIRNVAFSFSKLSMPIHEQLDLFINVEEVDKRRRLQLTIDEIKMRFGKNAILRATALFEGSTTIERHQLIGGHRL